MCWVLDVLVEPVDAVVVAEMVGHSFEARYAILFAFYFDSC